MMVAGGDGKATIEPTSKLTGTRESFPELSRQTIRNENTACTKLEPVFWNMGKSKFPFSREKPSISLFLSAWVTVFSITQHFTAERGCTQDASTIGSLLIISQTSVAGVLCWDPAPTLGPSSWLQGKSRWGGVGRLLRV